jgi:DNA-binding transcriptional LysR family regulator
MLADEEFVLYRRPDGFGIYDWLMAAFAKRGFKPKVTHEVHRLMASINIVAAGDRLSFVPASMQVLHQEAVVYRPLAPNTLPRLPLYLVHRADQNVMLVENFIRAASGVHVEAQTAKPSSRPRR